MNTERLLGMYGGLFQNCYVLLDMLDVILAILCGVEL